MIMVVPNLLAEWICTSKILPCERLRNNPHGLRAAFILSRELAAQKERLSNRGEVICRDKIVPHVIFRSGFGFRAIDGDLAPRVVSGKQTHECERRSFNLRDCLKTSQQFFVHAVNGWTLIPAGFEEANVELQQMVMIKARVLADQAAKASQEQAGDDQHR